MHQCLQIAEIVTVILETCLPQSERDNGWLETIARFGQTCQLFYEPAMDVLWRSQQLLHPLIKCMPSDLWRETSGSWASYLGVRLTLSFKRDPVPSDWVRFDHHARRVKILEYVVGGGPQHVEYKRPKHFLSYEIYAALSRRALSIKQETGEFRGLLPNLDQLRWPPPHDENYSIKYIHLIGEPKMTKVEFGPCMRTENDYWSSRAADHVVSCASTSFQFIGEHCPLLQKVSIHPPSSSWEDSRAELCNATSALVLRLPHLHAFDSSFILSRRAFTHLAHLPHLTRLKITLPDPENVSQVLITDPLSTLFPSLMSLSLKSGDGESCTAFLKTFREMRLEDLDITCTLPRNQTNAFRRCFASIGNRKSLQKLNVVVNLNPPLRHWEDADMAVDVILSSTLQPLLVLDNLAYLFFDAQTICDLDDSFLDSMASAWPRLVHLVIGSQRAIRSSRKPRATLGALIPFAKHCPLLEELAIWFSARVPDDDIQNEERMLKDKKHGLKSLSVGFSTAVSNPRAVAEFLHDLFPQAMIKHGMYRVDHSGIWDRSWEEVETILNELRSGSEAL